MLVVGEISKGEVLVRELGFKNLKEYARSPLYSLIKKHVLERDEHRCRVPGCPEEATRLGYVELNLLTLAGYPGCIFSLCVSHSNKSLIKLPPDSERHTLNKTFELLSGLQRRRGKSDRRIGYWFREQLSNPKNDKCFKAIRSAIRNQLPTFWRKVEHLWIPS